MSISKTDIPPEIEHIKDQNLEDGSNKIDNSAIACRNCNRGKWQ